MLKEHLPDFNNLQAVLKRGKPSKPVLFEFFLNKKLYEFLSGRAEPEDDFEYAKYLIKAFSRAGYDYATMHLTRKKFFHTHEHDQLESKSLDSEVMITGWKDMELYKWPIPENLDLAFLKKLDLELPGNMKIIIYGPSGVLENAIKLCGYQGLCFMLADDEKLAAAVFDKIGNILYKYYEAASAFSCVGACIVNDDWGFKTQTMLGASALRKYVIPWHRKIVKLLHTGKKSVILHSCGNLKEVMNDIIDDIGFDGKHSFEDSIQPVEEAYREYGSRIAIMGGIDLDFLIRESAENIKKRVINMLELTGTAGYAVGSGNSIPAYCPAEKYFAMTRAAQEY
ncbi:MAG: hypothetical protein A2096_11845 [Spirochaetes bacterium GWF1_41_5]|nr:MAG: hypothetical protein A2096_11845 [Spirochaetes bacterium GWF1_41_5]HBE04201.1 hypothetical protein [Spirochaetia bacterium]